MAYSVVPKTKRDGVITLKDGGAVTLDVAFEDGNFSFSQPQQFSELVVMDRGNFSAIRKQDEQAITGSFAFHFRLTRNTDFFQNVHGCISLFAVFWAHPALHKRLLMHTRQLHAPKHECLRFF